jgi:hypothetical protein
MIQILFAALLSGFVATWISIWHREREQIRQAKIRVFQDLLGNRHVLLPGPHEGAAAAAFSSAINQVAIVFHDCEYILLALKHFHEARMEESASAELRNNRLLELFKSMAKHLKVNTQLLGDGFLMRAFVVSQPAPQQLEFHFQGVRWQDGRAVVVGSLPFSTGGQRMPVFLPADFARSLGCALIELAVLAREHENELRATNTVIDVGTMGQDFMQRLERRRAINN